MTCILGARYSMTAQVRTQVTGQSRSGAVTRDYVDGPVVSCLVKGTRAGGVNALGSAERFDTEYYDGKVLKMYVSEAISQRSQVRDIVTRNGVRPWGNDEFEVVGYVPIIDPFGNVLEYEITLEKV